VITLGNHTYRRDGIGDYLARSETVIRPANAGSLTPGRGLAVVEARNGVKVAVLNLLGSLYLDTPQSPWEVVDTLVDGARERAPVVVLDFHAEATSEKVAIARWLDGRVTAVIGTHTHVPTADARVLPGGTAYITDAGMTGSRAGVLGVKRKLAVDALVTHMPVRFEPSDEDPWLMGVLISASAPLRADAVEQLLLAAPPAA
jgi:metallophosphoesterase (TIGR00282 family)